MVIVGNTLVVIDGEDNSGTPQSSVHTAPINANGTISSFQSAAALPEGRYFAGVTVVNGTIYVIGGVSPTSQASNLVYYTTPEPTSGAITQCFTTTLDILTTTGYNVSRLTAASYNGRFYQIGGTDRTTYFPNVYIVKPSSGGDMLSPNFTSTLQIGQNLVFASSETFAGQIYAIGGAVDNNLTGLNIIFSALIFATGDLYNPFGLSWQQSPVLSGGRINAVSVVSDSGWR